MRKMCIVSRPPVKNGIDPSNGKLGIDGGYGFPALLLLCFLAKSRNMKTAITATRTAFRSKIGIDPSNGKLGIDGGYGFPALLLLCFLAKSRNMKTAITATRTAFRS